MPVAGTTRYDLTTRLLKPYLARISHIECAEFSGDSRLPANERLRQGGILNGRALVNDRIANDGILHPAIGGNGGVRPDDRVGDFGGGVDVHRRDDDVVVSINLRAVVVAVIEKIAVRVQNGFRLTAILPHLHRL